MTGGEPNHAHFTEGIACQMCLKMVILWCRVNKNDTCYNGTWWRHQMETFSSLLAIRAGNSPVTGEFPAQRPVTLNFDVSFEYTVE